MTASDTVALLVALFLITVMLAVLAHGLDRLRGDMAALERRVERLERLMEQRRS